MATANNKFKRAVQMRNTEETNEQPIKNLPRIDYKQSDAAADKFDIDDMLVKDVKRSKNKTFYLEEEVIFAISRTAKSRKVSESKLVNDILVHVLKVD